ncbi:MAG: adenylate/guanylate cyclase domain-containing protein [Burkholderiales bacterium]|nr:adenylate/guanylate cyclase domain-containing protein [Burkholderiales bacterium]
MHDIRQWLQARGLGQHADAFEREQLDLDALPHLTEENLKDLGLPLGHRIKLLAAIRALQEAQAATEAPAADAGARVERRQLTVMFCDLVGSTRLAEQLDPEELRELMRTYQSACAQAVARYEGHVAQYLGDGLMIYFGWPKAHEDDAERSVRAGLEIVQAAGQIAAPQALQVRIGIATGDVVIGDTGAGDASVPKMAVGETPNLAARIQARAGPDKVIVADSTCRLLGGVYDLEDLGAHALKGFADPIRLWRVRGESRVDGRFAARGGGRLLPLVGRASELALITERWEQALDGEGQVVLLCGEPGVGKSRIAYTLRQQMTEASQAWWIQYQCSPFFSNTALYPVIEQIKRAAGFTEEDGADEKRARLFALLEAAGGTTPETVALYAALLSLPASSGSSLSELSPQQLKARTIEAVDSQYRRMLATRPVLVMVEDMHWIDPTTQELLDQLVAGIADRRMMLLVTHRPEFDPPWGTQAQITRLSLNRLSRRQCGEIAAQLASKPLPEALLTHIIEKADGVPLYVEEMTKAVLESDLLVDEGEQYALRGKLESLRIPATLHDSLMARLDRLLPVKEVAQIGAVIGREFERELLEAVAPMDAAALDTALEAFVRSELVYRRGVSARATYVFKHALVQEAAYNSLLKSRRLELHARIAEALEARFPDMSPEVIARHYSAAADAARAVPYWLRAGEVALARAANREASGHFARGIELVRTLPPSEARDATELELLIDLGEAQMRDGGAIEPMKTFEAAWAHAEARRNTDAMVRAAIGHADASWRPGLPNPTSIRMLKRASAALGLHDGTSKARVLASLALQFGMAGETDAARRVRGEAEAMGKRLGDPTPVVINLFKSVLYEANFGAVEQVGSLLRKIDGLVRQALEEGDSETLLDILPAMINARTWLGDVRGAVNALEDYAPLAERQRQPFLLYFLLSSRAGFALFGGRFEESEGLAQEALAVGQTMEGLDVVGPYGIQMFSLRREQGRLGEVAPLLRQFVSTTPRESSWRPGLALVYAELDMLDDARREFDQLATDDFAIVPTDSTWINCMAMLAEVCCTLGDTARAQTLYERLLPLAHCNVISAPTVACYGVAARQLGMLATATGQWNAAQGHFEFALEANAQQGGMPWVAHTQYQYARMLRARGRPEDRACIETLLAESAATAKALGMNALAARIAAC